jgi:peptide/nickel transport system permease protein
MRTLVVSFATLWFVTVLTFAATNLSGGNAAKIALGRGATPTQLRLFSEQQGLNQPIIERYGTWIGHIVEGNWGYSFTNHEPVSVVVLPRAERSLLLAGISLLLALPSAFGVGMLAARRPGGLLDNLLSTSTLVVLGLPTFVVGLIVSYVFASWLKVLPPDSVALSLGSATAKIEAFVLPTITLTLILTPYIARMVRTNVREVLGTRYTQAAVLRGVGGWRLFLRHILPNAIGPVINVVALSLADVLAGVVVIENVFAFPGLGQETVTAIGTLDIAVIQICVLVAATGFIVLNSAADILVVTLNPRLRRRQA